MDTYFNPEDLEQFGNLGEDTPELWNKFMEYYGASMADGALTAKEKALIAYGVALALQCPYCIDSYTQALLQMGVSRDAIFEASHVTAAMRAGTTLAHSLIMKNIVNKLEF
ncbi:arsenosugar biosynthesis-associated peroxidase-like protein [Eubacterium sp. F2]|jgi:alkylhydroperoxidase/carboxymuconolactone decarboxylase family protein|uniref:arsenosugar biosynthesis-associated peroxidase-like protein n=1 Tax=Eubacterium sp. F2 TaxID=3381348 RepID=UPI00360EF405